MMRRRFLGIEALLLAGSLFSLGAQDISVAGEWDIVAETQKGEVNWKAVFAQSGEGLDVMMTGPKGNSVKGQGTLKGDAIEWSIRVSSPRGEIDVVYKGVVAGDTMTGEVDRGTAGTAKWSAKRKAPSS
jgi:hypothetical protein